jgi:3-oxoacyl-[acyl-carrier-protein] synthase II
MVLSREVVITGVGVVCPIGVGQDAVWASLVEGRSGIRSLGWFGDPAKGPLGATVTGFEPGKFVRPRKNLKVMSRDIQLGVAAADMACVEAGVIGHVDPERFGVLYGADMIAADLEELAPAYRACMGNDAFRFEDWGQKALADLFPLWMLKYLPNMPACHIAIAQDARGPNNSLTMAEVSSLAAFLEAADAIRRGVVDVMIAGGTSSRIHPTVYLHNVGREMSRRCEDPAAACRPFDAQRDGMVYGEGAAAVVLESRGHAESRGAGDKILATLVTGASAFEPWRKPGQNDSRGGWHIEGASIRTALHMVLQRSGLSAGDIGHVNAHGLSTALDDRVEAQAIRDVLGDVFVTAPKSSMGNLGAACGAVETVVSLLALRRGLIPPTLNYTQPDPACPVRVVCGEPAPIGRKTAVVLNHAFTGQAVAMMISAENR